VDVVKVVSDTLINDCWLLALAHRCWLSMHQH